MTIKNQVDFLTLLIFKYHDIQNPVSSPRQFVSPPRSREQSIQGQMLRGGGFLQVAHSSAMKSALSLPQTVMSIVEMVLKGETKSMEEKAGGVKGGP